MARTAKHKLHWILGYVLLNLKRLRLCELESHKSRNRFDIQHIRQCKGFVAKYLR